MNPRLRSALAHYPHLRRKAKPNLETLAQNTQKVRGKAGLRNQASWGPPELFSPQHCLITI